MKNLFKNYPAATAVVGLFLSLNANPAAGQGTQKFNYFPSIIAQGKEVRTVYRPEDKHAKIDGKVYLFRNYKWEGHDLALSKTDTGYVSTYKIPEGTALMSYRFWNGDTVDVGAKFPYAIMVHQPDGKTMAPGAYSEWGIFRTKGDNGIVMPLVSPQAEIQPKVLVQLWLSKEYNNVAVRRNIYYAMAKGIKSYLPKVQADSVILAGGMEILAQKDVSEKERVMVEKVFKTLLQNRLLADSLKKTTLSIYPNGLRKRLALVDSIYLTMKPEERLARFRDFEKKYPFDKFSYDDYLNPAIGDPAFFVNAYNGVIIPLFMAKKYEEVKAMIKLAPYRLLGYYYLQFVDYPSRRPGELITPEKRQELSTFLINTIKERSLAQDETLSGRGYFTPSEWKHIAIDNYKESFVYHAGMLYKTGDYAGAKKIIDYIKPFVGHHNIDFNTIYVNLLDRENLYKDAKKYIIEAVKIDKASPEMLSLLKNYYERDHGKPEGFDDYYISMIPKEHILAFQEKLRKTMVNIPAPGFKLTNMDGAAVDLEQQKGKLVVIDFWATWCFPCKAAMPGMQTLVKKYKSDPNIQFYFISTLEEDPNYKAMAKAFIKDKKYDFNVLFDEQTSEGKHSGIIFEKYAKLLKLSGIPQKVIIDAKGNIRWTSDGFNGDLVNLTREVDYIISVIQNEQAK